MRIHGNLIKWDDDRGFGFIEPATGHVEIFVHISAFPRDGVRPCIGELVSYEVDAGRNGKPQATRIMRPGTIPRLRRSPTAARTSRRKGLLARVGGALLLAAIGAYFYFSLSQPLPPTASRPEAVVAPPAVPTRLFSCDGRTRCSQMTSCAEARYFMDHCPGTMMDGNHDGVPCQSQWCGASHDAWP